MTVGGGLTLDDVAPSGLSAFAGWPSLPALRADAERRAARNLQAWPWLALERGYASGLDVAEEDVLRLLVAAARRRLADPDAVALEEAVAEAEAEPLADLLARERLARLLVRARALALAADRRRALREHAGLPPDPDPDPMSPSWSP